MSGVWAVILQVVTQFIAFWIKDKHKKEQFEKNIDARLKEYEKETMTSSDIRSREQETKDRLLEKLRSRGVVTKDDGGKSS